MIAIRRKHKVRRSPKPKLLLDEGLPPRAHFRELNNYCDVKHVKHDYRLGGVVDDIVYSTAQRYGRVLVTFNPNDFKSFITDRSVTVIGLSMKLTDEEIDTKLTSLIRTLKSSHFKGHYFAVTKYTRS